MASLSSRDTHVRQAGYHVLSRFMAHLEGSRFKERKQVSLKLPRISPDTFPPSLWPVA